MYHPILNKLTILIPTYNRAKYLKQTIKYWSDYNVKLIIIDGSDQKFEDNCLKSKNVKYIYNKAGYYDRLLSSINHIETEFMILGCDDDFYLPSALVSCINFLIKNKSFTFCGGRAIGFATNKNQIFFQKNYLKLKDLCLNQDNPEERIINHFKSYVPTHIYSVTSSSNWKKICKHVFEKEYNFFASMELQLEFLAMITGKSKIIPELLWLRNNIIPTTKGTNVSMSRDHLIDKWWNDKTSENEKADFLYRMKIATNELLINQNLIFNEKKIEELFEIYINNSKYKNKIFNKIKHKISSFIKQIFSFRKNKYPNHELSVLEMKGVLINHLELNKVISTIKYLKYNVD